MGDKRETDTRVGALNPSVYLVRRQYLAPTVLTNPVGEFPKRYEFADEFALWEFIVVDDS